MLDNLIRLAPCYRVSGNGADARCYAADDEAAVIRCCQAAYPGLVVSVRDGERLVADIRADNEHQVFVEYFHVAGGVRVASYYECNLEESLLVPLDHVPSVFAEDIPCK